MNLYDLPWGPWPRRVTIYLKEKGITGINLISLSYGEEKSPDLLKKNPLGYLPILELADGRVVVDSIAIMEYLEELHPTPSFSGGDALERARIRAFLNLINEFYFKALPVYVNRIPQFSRALTQSAQTADWMEPFFERCIDGLEMLADRDGPFLMGERITFADCALYPLIHHNIENYKIETITNKHPRLKRWVTHFSGRPSAACPLRDDGLREADVVPPASGGKEYWWQKRAVVSERRS